MMINNRFFGVVSLFSLFTLLILPGCGRTGLTLNPDGSEGIGFTDRATGDVVNLGENVTIPEDFPSYIPRFSNAIVMVAIKDVAQNSYNTAQDVPEEMQAVRRFIDQVYQSTDFKVTNEVGSDDLMLFDYENATIRVHYQVARDIAKGKTSIILVSTDKTKIVQ